MVKPELKVKVAVPLGPVVTVCALRMPVSAASVTTTPGTTAFVALSAVTVIVVGLVLLEGIDVAEAESERLAAVMTVAVLVAAVLVVTPLPPQLTNKAVIAANIKADKDLA